MKENSEKGPSVFVISYKSIRKLRRFHNCSFGNNYIAYNWTDI